MTSISRWGNEVRFDSDTGSSFNSAIAALADGRWVATWTYYPPSGYAQIHAQILNADGSRQGDQFVVAASATGSQLHDTVTALPNGGFVIAWGDQSGGRENAVAQIFDKDGHASGSRFSHSPDPGNSNSAPQLATLPGGFVGAWDTYDLVENEAGVVVRVFDADGMPAGGNPGFQPGGQISGDPDIAVLADGRVVTAWEDGSGVRARVSNIDGTPDGAAFDLSVSESARDPRLTALGNGGFAAAWNDPFDSEDFDVYLRVYDANGTAASAEILVNGASDQSQFDQAIAQLSDGCIVVAWSDEDVDDESGHPLYAIRAQLFDPDGSKSGDALLVNTAAPGFGQLPAITVLADGRFVISWDDFRIGEFGPESSERAQIFDAREGPVTLNGTPLDDNWFGTPFDDTMQGASGNDRLDGAAGDDTARYTGTRGQYAISDLGDHFVVAGPDGTDTLYNFEFVQFSSGTPERLTHDAPTPHGPEPIPNTPAGHISGLFDTRYYLSHYADVFAAGVSALDHYDTFGWHEGRAPNAFFDSTGYLAANPEVRDAGQNPLEHYHVAGWLEQRDPSASFDTTLYLIHNPDVAAAHVDPLEHYMQHGMAEGRAIYAAVGRDIVGGFDAEYYVFHNPDVAAAGVDPRAHYDQFGWHEGRKPNAWFDSAGYLAHYADVAAARVNPLDHYQQFGWKEGRDPSAGFDTLGYLAANPDVAAAGVNPLEHYLQFGTYEGRQAVSDGLWH